MSKGIIVVMVQFRLGIFGLCLLPIVVAIVFYCLESLISYYAYNVTMK